MEPITHRAMEGVSGNSDLDDLPYATFGFFEMYPIVDPEKCSGCGNCVEVCPSAIYQIEDGKSIPLKPEDCIECWACVNECPEESIQLYED